MSLAPSVQPRHSILCMATVDVATQPGVPTRHSRAWVFCAAVAAVCAVIMHDRFLGFFDLYGLFGNGVDAIVYRYGGGTILDSEHLYAFSLFDTKLPFTYPPFAAVMFVVLAGLSVSAATTMVTIFNGVLLYLAVLLSWRLLGYRGIGTHAVSIGMAFAFSWLEPVRMTIWLGQINLLLLVLVLGDLARPEGSRLRGVGVGLAAGIKLTPAFFIVYALALRQFRTVVVASATFAVTVALGFVVVFDDARTFWTSALFQSDRIGMLASPANQSVHGILARAWPSGAPPAAVWVACSILVAVLGIWSAVVAHRRGAQLLSLTICGLTTPMVSPFSWGHHWVWCVPLIVLTLDYARRSRWHWGALVTIAATAPFVAWYYTAPEGVAVIGTFMFDGTDWAESLARVAYPLVFVAVIGVALVALFGLRSHHAPRVELGAERHGSVRRARGGQPNQGDIGGQRDNVFEEAAFSLGAVEEDPIDGAVIAKKPREVVGLDRGFDDRRIEASVPSAQLQHVPHRDPVA